ncbi:MAG: phosphohydrolase [Treponema sp. GWB1_62_6]|nr:MAG: phosphohydrolase [Treponema sp. GWB1_62_6]OHE74545.1 MAG: phosphohydrolase [Treponema sp. RIFOXYC1_FULL_61_9]
MKSPKELSLDKKLVSAIEELDGSGHASKIAALLLADAEVHAMQEYANTVSIKRLGYNDHGPVHMRKVALNAVIMMGLLKKAGIRTSLETEESGDFDDGLVAVILASFLHDLGMTIGRQDHELHSAYLAYPILDRLLKEIYHDSIQKRVVIRSLAVEGIVGHMANRKIHSIEAGVILIADGCDMERGRARIPMAMAAEPRVGDIHKYSANSILDVALSAGAEKPIRIDVSMSSEVGFFQVEEVLLGKIASSTAKGYIEMYAQVVDGESKRYL